jgi:hypothetical protein
VTGTPGKDVFIQVTPQQRRQIEKRLLEEYLAKQQGKGQTHSVVPQHQLVYFILLHFILVYSNNYFFAQRAMRCHTAFWRYKINSFLLFVKIFC